MRRKLGRRTWEGPERKYLRALTTAVRHYLRCLDALMKEPATHTRGQRIARLSNALEMANDRARYFGLGVDWRKDARKRR